MNFENINIPKHSIKWVRASTKPNKSKGRKKHRPSIAPPLLCAPTVLMPQALIQDQLNVVCVLGEDSVVLVDNGKEDDANG